MIIKGLLPLSIVSIIVQPLCAVTSVHPTSAEDSYLRDLNSEVASLLLTQNPDSQLTTVSALEDQENNSSNVDVGADQTFAAMSPSTANSSQDSVTLTSMNASFGTALQRGEVLEPAESVESSQPVNLNQKNLRDLLIKQKALLSDEPDLDKG